MAEETIDAEEADCIVVEEVYEEQTQEQQETPGEGFEDLRKVIQGCHSPWLRVLAVFLFFLSGVICAVVAFAFLVSSALTALTLFRVPRFYELAKRFARMAAVALVSTLGFFVAIFHFSLGLGIIFLYIAIEGESADSIFGLRFFTQ